MTNEKRDEMDLNSYFEAGRAAAPQPSEALLARILADAGDEATRLATPVVAVQTKGFRAFWAAIGGWPTAGGLVTATLVGVWIGVYQPAGLEQLADSYLGGAEDSYLVDVLPSFDDILLEG